MGESLSVIVLSKNNGTTIGYTLKSIVESKLPANTWREIIVVDAHSTDITHKVLAKFRKKIKVIYDEGKGIGLARNTGIEAARGEIICFVDADCIVGKNHFIRVLAEFSRGADLVDVEPTPPLDVGSTSIARLEAIIRRYGRGYSERLISDRCFIGGALMCFRKKVFKTVGGFWEYPPYGFDDIDFGYRARKAGYKIHVIKVDGSYSRPRERINELVRQQIGWGKGFAYIIAKYRHDRDFWRCYRYSSYVYMMLGSYSWMYPIIAAIFSPIKGVFLAFRTGEVSVLPYWIIRRMAFLWGILLELKKAFSYYVSRKLSS